MRANPAEFDLLTPGSLDEALSLLSHEPLQWLPIAGGTDVMVQYSAGNLPNRKLLNLWNLKELRGIEVRSDTVRIGSSTTYTAIRGNEALSREFPLLAQAASWTGGIANQNRGTLGGNIVNASPAADSLPALLVYDAVLILVSIRGERRVPYSAFHSGYKKMDLGPDELLQSIVLPRRYSGYFSYARKTGARNAQAISKVCVAALGRISGGLVDDVRIALGSVAPVPLRLTKTEQLLNGKKLDAPLIETARKSIASQIQPIDDIRSTARYRAAVSANLAGEFLEKLSAQESRA